MKKLIALPLLALLSVPAYANYMDDSEMIEAQEAEEGVYEGYDAPLEGDEINADRMEDQQEMENRNQNSSTIIESEEAIDYDDRTRTRRARNAINTGSDASDDQ